MTTPSMSEVLLYLQAGKELLDILKTLGGLLPKGQKHDELQRRLVDADKALRASEVQLAKALGYHLCQCTFPPQIMLSKGYHPVHGRDELFVCPTCNRQEPPPLYFQQMDEASAQLRNLRSDWMA